MGFFIYFKDYYICCMFRYGVTCNNVRHRSRYAAVQPDQAGNTAAPHPCAYRRAHGINDTKTDSTSASQTPPTRRATGTYGKLSAKPRQEPTAASVRPAPLSAGGGPGLHGARPPLALTGSDAPAPRASRAHPSPPRPAGGHHRCPCPPRRLPPPHPPRHSPPQAQRAGFTRAAPRLPRASATAAPSALPG